MLKQAHFGVKRNTGETGIRRCTDGQPFKMDLMGRIWLEVRTSQLEV